MTGDACREVVHPDVYKKLLEEIEPGRAHGLRVASGTMRDEPIKQTTNSAIVGGACGHRVPIAGHTSGRQFQPGKDERLKFRVLQILKNRTPSPAPGTSSPPPSPADPCSCADEQCCWRWTLLAVLSDIWAISHIEPGLVDFSHQSDRSTGSNLPASTASVGCDRRRIDRPRTTLPCVANYPHRRGAGDAAALQEPQEGLPGSRIARRPSCSPGKAVLMRLTLSIPRRVRRPSRRGGTDVAGDGDLGLDGVPGSRLIRRPLDVPARIAMRDRVVLRITRELQRFGGG